MIINIKEAAPSLGKTYGAVQWAKDSEDRFIFSSISLLLCKQTYTLIKDKCPHKKVLMITSEESYVNGVFGRFKEALQEDWDIILVSHICLELSYKQGLDFQEWNLIIDEVPNNLVEVSSVKQLVIDETTMFTPYLVRTAEKTKGNWTREIFKLKSGITTELEERIDYLKSAGSKSMSREMQGLYEYLALGGAIQRWQEDTNLKEANYLYIKIINPLELLKTFKRVTLIAANIKDTLLGKIWSSIFKINWKDEDNIKLRADTLPNTDKITIYPLLPKESNMSRYLMDKKGGENGETVFEMGLDAAKSFFGDEKFLYSVNTYREANVKNGIQIPVKAHGLNNFSHLHNALLLFSYNPDSFTKEILMDLAIHFKLPEETFVDAFIVSNYLESSFQASTRLSTRNHTSVTPVKILVADTRCANYLINTWFSCAKIDDSMRMELFDGRSNNTGRPKKSLPATLHMSKKERAKFYYLQRKEGKQYDTGNKEHVEEVKNWLVKFREENK